MPTPTYVPLANVTLTSTASSVYFSSISQSYRHLVLVVAPSSTSDTFMYLQMNGIGGSSYTWGAMVGDGSSTFLQQSISTEAFDLVSGIGGAANAITKVDFMDYTATDKNKAVIWRTDRPSNGTIQGAGTLTTAGAITQIRVWEYGSNVFGVGSTFALYGIAG
jgi:hypothetical protein